MTDDFSAPAGGRLPAPPAELREPLPLFAYGTLESPELTANLLEHDVARSGARLPGFEKVWFEGFDYPTLMAVEGDRGSAVRGTLYRALSNEDYRRLDHYEGVHEGLYQRVRVEIEADDATAAEPAYVYLITDRTAARLRGR